MDLEEAINFSNVIKMCVKGLHIVGSIKRNEPIVNDIDFITTRDLDDIENDILGCMIPNNIEIKKLGRHYMRIEFKIKYNGEKIGVDIWRARTKNEYNIIKIMRGLDKGHNIYLRKRARELGMVLSDKSLKDRMGREINIENKKHLFNILNINE